MKDTERLQNCFRLKEAKEIGQLNAMYDPELDSRPENKIDIKGIIRTIGETIN